MAIGFIVFRFYIVVNSERLIFHKYKAIIYPIVNNLSPVFMGMIENNMFFVYSLSLQ